MSKTYDGITPELERVAAQMRNTRPLMLVATNAVRDCLRVHFRARGGTFWPKFAGATKLGVVTARTGEVIVSGVGAMPFGAVLEHKIKGGIIKAKPPRQFLAIPNKANPKAKDAGWPSHFSRPGDGKLKALYRADGEPYALVLTTDYKSAMAGMRAAKVLPADYNKRFPRHLVLYWLERMTKHQKPDPKALPHPQRVYDAIRAAVDRRMATLIKAGAR